MLRFSFKEMKPWIMVVYLAIFLLHRTLGVLLLLFCAAKKMMEWLKQAATSISYNATYVAISCRLFPIMQPLQRANISNMMCAPIFLPVQCVDLLSQRLFVKKFRKLCGCFGIVHMLF